MEASRPTWTLRRKAEEKADYVGKRLRVEVLEAATTVSEPLPVEPLVEVDLWKQRAFRFVPPARVVSRSQSLRGPDEVQFAFHPTLTRLWSLKGRRSQRLIEAPGDNRKAYGFGLVDWRDGWFDGRIAPGRTADIFCQQVRAAVARSRVAWAGGDYYYRQSQNPHSGGLLARARAGLTELADQLYLVYTPAYDPDANRIEWLWRISRRIVTHNHHSKDFETLLTDARTHFETLTRTPDDLLRHIGSPFALDNRHSQSQTLAA
jgi:hypothetical protein